MNPPSREEQAARLIEGTLGHGEKTELDRLLRDDPQFARTVEAAQSMDEEMETTGRWLRNQPSFMLDSEAIARVRAAARARRGRARWGLWLGLGGLVTACIAVVVAVYQPSRYYEVFAPREAASLAPAQRGERLYARAAERNPVTRIGVWEPEKPTVRACLWIVEEEWDVLSAREREAVIHYLKTQVPVMRGDPDRYADASGAAADRALAAHNIANMREGAFIVFTMVRQGDAWVRGRTAASG